MNNEISIDEIKEISRDFTEIKQETRTLQKRVRHYKFDMEQQRLDFIRECVEGMID